MNTTLRTFVVASTFIALALTLSTLSVYRISYRPTLLGLEGVAGTVLTELSRLAESGRGASENEGAPRIAGAKYTPNFIQLTVSILERASGNQRFVRDVPVNVIMVREVEDLVGGDAIIPGPEKGVERQTQVASGVTDVAGTVTFLLFAGNYTILTQHLGLLGNFSITLRASSPRVSLQWIFSANLEKPLIVQMNDENADKLVSPGENITLFYQSASRDVPRRMVLVMGDAGGQTTGLSILSFGWFSGNVYAVVTPKEPIGIASLGLDSTLLIGTASYEVSLSG